VGSPESIILTYQRGGGRTSPPDREYFYAHIDGTFVMWRSVAWATYPPTPIGRFAGLLSPEITADLKREVAAANAVGRINQRSSPDAPAETIETGQTRADVGIHDLPNSPWGPLFTRIRKFLLDLTKYPEAALALTVSADGQRVQLHHQGNQVLRLDLSAVVLQAALWKPAESVTLAEWTSRPINLGSDVNAAMGWSLDVPFKPDFATSAGSSVKVRATLTAFDSSSAVPVALSTP